MNLQRFLVSTFLTLSFTIATPIAAARDVTGQVFEPDSNRKNLLFLFEHHDKETGTQKIGKSVYTYPDGKIATVETTYFEKGKLKKFHFVQAQKHDEGTIEFIGDEVKFSYTSEGKTKTESEKIEGDVLTTAEIADYIRTHFNTLLNGDSVKFRIAVVDRLETVGFKVYKDKEITYEGKEAIVVKLKPSSILISAIVDPIKMTFEKGGDRKLWISLGRLPVKEPRVKQPKSASDWKPLDAELVLKYP